MHFSESLLKIEIVAGLPMLYVVIGVAAVVFIALVLSALLVSKKDADHTTAKQIVQARRKRRPVQTDELQATDDAVVADENGDLSKMSNSGASATEVDSARDGDSSDGFFINISDSLFDSEVDNWDYAPTSRSASDSDAQTADESVEQVSIATGDQSDTDAAVEADDTVDDVNADANTDSDVADAESVATTSDDDEAEESNEISDEGYVAQTDDASALDVTENSAASQDAVAETEIPADTAVSIDDVDDANPREDVATLAADADDNETSDNAATLVAADLDIDELSEQSDETEVASRQPATEPQTISQTPSDTENTDEATNDVAVDTDNSETAEDTTVAAEQDSPAVATVDAAEPAQVADDTAPQDAVAETVQDTVEEPFVAEPATASSSTRSTTRRRSATTQSAPAVVEQTAASNVAQTKPKLIVPPKKPKADSKKKGGTPQTGMKGKLEISTDGEVFYFSLFASNGTRLYESRPYPSEKICRKDIRLFTDFLSNQTRLDIRQDRAGNFRWFYVNGATYFVGEAFKSRESAEKNAESVKKFSATAVIVAKVD